LIAIFSALKQEVGSLKKGMLISEPAYPGCRVYQGICRRRDYLLVLTGVGKEHTEKTVKMVLDRYNVSGLVSTGFSGALNSKTRAGDIVVYAALDCGEKDGAAPHSNTPLQADSNLLSSSKKSLEETKLRFIVGNGITIPFICKTPEAKFALGKEFEADSVDMESYWIGLMAAERNLPFITVRSIFDLAADDLTLLSQIASGRRAKRIKAVSHIVSHPGQIISLARYARNAARAERNLAVFLRRLLENTAL
jgi:nucleoside phosphorylase